MMLVTDIVFPNKYAKWRIEESKAFIDIYNSDFLVYKIDSYADIKYDIDYDEMKEYYNLELYNIIIFDKKFNHINKYNKRIDGTKFNCDNGFSYLFTRNDKFDISNYKTVYHIFLSMYERFNNSFKFPKSNQFIHLYPGGGLSGKNAISKIHKDTKVISTNHNTTEWLKAYKHTNYIDVLGGTLLPKNHKVRYKNKNEGELTVCFSNMGVSTQKGAPVYKLMVEKYKTIYPKHNVKFISIGNCLPSPHITNFSPMPIKQLDDFYNNNVDIILNLENGTAYNGWPLGCEAILQGVVLITTDVHNANKYVKYTNEMLFIIDKTDTKSMIKAISSLHDNRDLLLSMSNKIQNYSSTILSYENQQDKIFEYIDNVRYHESFSMYRKFSPKYFTEDTIYTIKSKQFPLIVPHNVEIKNNNIKEFIFNKIKNNEKMSLSRYNDGEWVCMLRMPDKNLYNTHKVKWDKNTEDFVDKNITPIVKTIPYYVGISNEVLKSEPMVKNIYEYIKDLKIFDGGLFARWQITGVLFEMLDLLKDKNVIIVGPDYLVNLKKYINFKHIVTDNELKLKKDTLITKNNGFSDRCAVVYQYEDLAKRLADSIIDKCVVLYACAFVSKKFIHDYHERDIIQIDVGAAFDNVCGLQTRPWHFN